MLAVSNEQELDRARREEACDAALRSGAMTKEEHMQKVQALRLDAAAAMHIRRAGDACVPVTCGSEGR